MDDRIPETPPGGSLVPPSAASPGTLSAPTPLLLRSGQSRVRPLSFGRRDLRALVDTALDELDELGDRIAGAVGIR